MEHYVRFTERLLADHFPEVSKRSAGTEQLFNDVTFDGTRIQFVILPRNEQGFRVGVLGRTRTFHAGLMHAREAGDTLLIYGTASEGAIRGFGEPQVHEAQFSRFQGRESPKGLLDPLPFLREARTSIAGDDGTIPPSPALLDVIARMSAFCARVRPGPDTEIVTDEGYQLRLRSLWVRFRLHECVEPSFPARFRAILDGRIRFQASRANLDAMALGMGIPALNRFVTTHVDKPQRIQELLEMYSALPLPESVRARLWASALKRLSPENVRLELCEAAPFLKKKAEDNAVAREWEAPVVNAIRSLGTTDSGLDELVAHVDRDDEPLAAVARWAWNLHFEHASAEQKAEAASAPAKDVPVSASSPPAPAHAPLPTSPQPPTAPASIQPSAFDVWVLGLGCASTEELQGVAEDIRRAARELESASDYISTADGCLALVKDLGNLQERLERWRKALPYPEQLAQDIPYARTAYNDAKAALGEHVDSLLRMAGSTPPDELNEIADMAQRLQALELLPAWCWQSEELPKPNSEVETGAVPAKLRALVSPHIRRRVRLVLRTLHEANAELPASIASLEAPANPGEEDLHLERELRRLLEAKRALDAIPTEHHRWVRAALENQEEPSRLQRAVELLERLRDKLAPGVFAGVVEVVGLVRGTEEREAAARSYHRATEQLIAALGTAEDVTLPQLQRTVSRQAAPLPMPTEALSIEHNWTGESGRKALPGLRLVEGAPYVETVVPLSLETEDNKAYNVLLEYRVSTGQRDAWPREWPQPSPERLSLRPRDWRPDFERKGRYVATFRLRIPIRKLRARERFEVVVSIYDAETRTPLAKSTTLSWDVLEPEPKLPDVHWTEECNPDFVTQHPVGPQTHRETLEKRIAQGASFAVEAPRRFGKTTLVRYLRTHASRDDLLVPESILCTQFHDGVELDYAKLWKAVSDSLQAAVGSAVDLTHLSDGLPQANAFDHVRRAAAREGKSTVLILLDEAQLFFPRERRGQAIGTWLKDLLEENWAVADESRARLSFGLIGLPGMVERAGVNLMGKLRPLEVRNIDEEGLNRLVLQVTRRTLETTRGARREISRVASNLLVLRDILERLVRNVRRDGRCWVSFDDVVEVENELITELRDGQASAVASSLRDAFNQAESINDWVPGPTYPVAAALAHWLHEGLPFEDAVRRSADKLTEWATSAQAVGGLSRFVFDVERVREIVGTLRSEHIVEGTRFRSELTEAYLVGAARNGFVVDTAARNALLLAAVKRVRPTRSPLEPLAEGGQARLYRFKDGNDTLVWREATLAGDEERGRFIQGSHALATVVGGVTRRTAGSEFVFDLLEVGLLEGNDSRAVQIYRWIDGFDLSNREGALLERAVADIGAKLCRALTWLHSAAVLHRDIRPKNIILHAEDMRPILIDFGLATLAQSARQTRLSGEFVAPEVCAEVPQWSPAADVFALGCTLRKLLRPEANRFGLPGVLERTTNPRPESRMNARELGLALEDVAVKASLGDIRNRAWQRYGETVGLAKASPLHREILEKMRPSLEAVAIGLHPDVLDRCTVVADLSNQLLEASSRDGDKLTLGNVKHTKDESIKDLATPAVDVLHQLRTFRNHGGTSRGRLVKRLGKSEAELVPEVLEGATQVGKCLGLKAFGDLARLVVKVGAVD
nr:protein kinase [Corallococcus coralloides]